MREHAAREECGRVVTSPTQPEYIGASRPTNNTGELSAMHHALRGARELAKQGEHVLIISDSQLAICTTTGAWASRKHKLLVANNRRALARLVEAGSSSRRALATALPYTSGTPVHTLATRSTRGQTS